MIEQVDPAQARLGGIVEDNIADFVDELRQIDLVDLTSFLRFESFPTVEDLVNTSTELYFKPNRLVFAWTAGVELRWDALPVVTLGLEFRHPEVSVFFNLTLRDADQRVDVMGVVFDPPAADPVQTLENAFAEARLVVGATSPLTLLRPAQRRNRGVPKGLPWP